MHPELPGARTRGRLLIPLSLALLAMALPASLFLGVAEFSPEVFWYSRVPRLLALLCAGAGLSVAGLIMQGLSGNSFVSPDTAGTLDAARLGWVVAVALVPGAALAEIVLISFATALGGTVIFWLLSRRLSAQRLILAPLLGLLLGVIFDGISSYLGLRFDVLQSLGAREQGDFSLVVAGRWELLFLVLPLVILAGIYARQFTIAGLGQDQSTNLGIPYVLVSTGGFALVSLVSVAVLLTAGRLPLVGLLVPAWVRWYGGSYLPRILVLTMILGAGLLLVCDVLGRVLVYPFEIPVSLTLSLAGGLGFLFLLSKKPHAPGGLTQ